MGIWSGTVRIDVAVINGEMHGFELKSAKDTLARLPAQRDIYSLVFDRLTLVVAENHRSKALSIIPDWWGVISAKEHSDGVALEDFRQAELNPEISKMQVARLLWRTEALGCLGENGGTTGLKSAAAEKLAAELCARLDLAELRAAVRAKLKKREHWLRKVLRDERKMAVSADLHPLRATAGS